MEINKTNLTSGSAALLAIIAIVMSFGLIGQDDVYVCLDTDIAMQCPDGLSKINKDGLQTQCKFFSEELNRSTYKKCSSGWLPYTPEPEITRNLNFSFKDPVYLFCDRQSGLIKMCQIINENETLYKLSLE